MVSHWKGVEVENLQVIADATVELTERLNKNPEFEDVTVWRSDMTIHLALKDASRQINVEVALPDRFPSAQDLISYEFYCFWLAERSETGKQFFATCQIDHKEFIIERLETAIDNLRQETPLLNPQRWQLVEVAYQNMIEKISERNLQEWSFEEVTDMLNRTRIYSDIMAELVRKLSESAITEPCHIRLVTQTYALMVGSLEAMKYVVVGARQPEESGEIFFELWLESFNNQGIELPNTRQVIAKSDIIKRIEYLTKSLIEEAQNG